jgi:hypothetical protein
MLGAASSTATEGAVALTERRYLEAAELFGQAAGYVPNGHSNERGNYFLSQAVILFRQGDERGDNAALRSSIETCGNALAEYAIAGTARMGDDGKPHPVRHSQHSASARAGRCARRGGPDLSRGAGGGDT